MDGRSSAVDHGDPSHRARVPRARSLPSARPFRVAVFFTTIHYLGIVATITALVAFFLEPTQAASRIFIGGMLFSAVTWLIAFFKRRGTYCPLCKGTPLINTGARTHARAQRLLPFNHGVTATLSIIAMQKFRCMYCGSDYDLLKPSSRLHGHGEYQDQDPSLSHESRS